MSPAETMSVIQWQRCRVTLILLFNKHD